MDGIKLILVLNKVQINKFLVVRKTKISFEIYVALAILYRAEVFMLQHLQNIIKKDLALQCFMYIGWV